MLLCHGWGEFAVCHRGCTCTQRKEIREIQLKLSSCFVPLPPVSLAVEEFAFTSTHDPISYNGITLSSARWPLVTKQQRTAL